MKRALALTMALATACAGPLRVAAPVDRGALRPSAGRTAVRVRAPRGAVQHVAVVPASTALEQGMVVDPPWCDTPCTLYLAPGRYTLWTGAPTILDALTPVDVRDRPLAVGLRAASRTRLTTARASLIGGVGLVVVGGIFVASSPLQVTGGAPDAAATIAVGVGLAAVGAAFIVWATRALATVDRTPPTVTEEPAP